MNGTLTQQEPSPTRKLNSLRSNESYRQTCSPRTHPVLSPARNNHRLLWQHHQHHQQSRNHPYSPPSHPEWHLSNEHPSHGCLLLRPLGQYCCCRRRHRRLWCRDGLLTWSFAELAKEQRQSTLRKGPDFREPFLGTGAAPVVGRVQFFCFKISYMNARNPGPWCIF